MEAFCFFSSRRRHTRYWRDWSSDVCSSDLAPGRLSITTGCRQTGRSASATMRGTESAAPPAGDRKSVGEGKSVDLGGRRIIKKKKQIHSQERNRHLHQHRPHRQLQVTTPTF